MNWFFLQIDTSAAAAQAATALNQPAQEISIIDLLSKGGVLMIPLALLLVVAIFCIHRKTTIYPQGFQDRGEFHEHHSR